MEDEMTLTPEAEAKLREALERAGEAILVSAENLMKSEGLIWFVGSEIQQQPPTYDYGTTRDYSPRPWPDGLFTR